jgi:hypothetical protein
MRQYDDGLDADGYPLDDGAWRKPFIHGDESEAGDFKPVHIGEAIARLIDRASRCREVGGNCDSPIEEALGAAILLCFEHSGHPLKLCKVIDLKASPDELVLVPQFAWSFYRSDWAILNPKRAGALLIECDGKEFHSSPEQIAHDTTKDAAALNRGYLTMRFSGSQIHRDPDGCAQKIFDVVSG